MVLGVAMLDNVIEISHFPDEEQALEMADRLNDILRGQIRGIGCHNLRTRSLVILLEPDTSENEQIRIAEIVLRSI